MFPKHVVTVYCQNMLCKTCCLKQAYLLTERLFRLIDQLQKIIRPVR